MKDFLFSTDWLYFVCVHTRSLDQFKSNKESIVKTRQVFDQSMLRWLKKKKKKKTRAVYGPWTGFMASDLWHNV